MFFLITLQHFTSRTSFFISFLVFFFFVFFLCSCIVIIVCYISLNQSNSSRFLSARSLSMYIYSSISLYLCIIPRIYLSFIWHIIFSFYSRLIHWIVRGGAFFFYFLPACHVRIYASSMKIPLSLWTILHTSSLQHPPPETQNTFFIHCIL